MARLGLHFRMQAFSSCGEQGLLSCCDAQASYCGGFSCCGAQAQELCPSGLVVPAACGIFPDQGLNPGSLHSQVDSTTGSPGKSCRVDVIRGHLSPFLLALRILVLQILNLRLFLFNLIFNKKNRCHLEYKVEMATHSSILAWKIPWTEEPSRLQSMGSQKSNTTEQLHFTANLMTLSKHRCFGAQNGFSIVFKPLIMS